MSIIRARLAERGLVLPPPVTPPAGLRLPFPWVRLVGERVFVSGHGPQAADGRLAGPFGKLGQEVTLADGRRLAQLTALGMLASLERALGDLDRIAAWCRVFGMVNAVPSFTEHPLVINGFSELILELFGAEVGAHARSAVGHVGLPFDMAVEVEAELLVHAEARGRRASNRSFVVGESGPAETHDAGAHDTGVHGESARESGEDDSTTLRRITGLATADDNAEDDTDEPAGAARAARRRTAGERARAASQAQPRRGRADAQLEDRLRQAQLRLQERLQVARAHRARNAEAPRLDDSARQIEHRAKAPKSGQRGPRKAEPQIIDAEFTVVPRLGFGSEPRMDGPVGEREKEPARRRIGDVAQGRRGQRLDRDGDPLDRPRPQGRDEADEVPGIGRRDHPAQPRREDRGERPDLADRPAGRRQIGPRQPLRPQILPPAEPDIEGGDDE